MNKIQRKGKKTATRKKIDEETNKSQKEDKNLSEERIKDSIFTIFYTFLSFVKHYADHPFPPIFFQCLHSQAALLKLCYQQKAHLPQNLVWVEERYLEF